MPTKIRLQRQGKKGQPFYHIIIADGRAPRDGRNIERIGTYNPVAKPAEVVLDFDRALYWVQTGAQPTDTVRSLLSYKGVLYKNHLLKGVAKGAMTEQQAELKYQEWMEAKQAKIENAGKELENKERATEKERIEAETKIKEARLEEIAKRRQAELDKEAEEKRAAAKQAEEAKQEAEAEVRDAKDAAPEAKAEETPEETKEETTEDKKEA
jgi:small subunit ribosomal protein S16